MALGVLLTVLTSVIPWMKLQTVPCCSPEPGPVAGPQPKVPHPLGLSGYVFLPVGPPILISHHAPYLGQLLSLEGCKIHSVIKFCRGPSELPDPGPQDPK